MCDCSRPRGGARGRAGAGAGTAGQTQRTSTPDRLQPPFPGVTLNSSSTSPWLPCCRTTSKRSHSQPLTALRMPFTTAAPAFLGLPNWHSQASSRPAEGTGSTLGITELCGPISSLSVARHSKKVHARTLSQPTQSSDPQLVPKLYVLPRANPLDQSQPWFPGQAKELGPPQIKIVQIPDAYLLSTDRRMPLDSQ